VSGPAYRVVEANNTVEASYSGTAKQLDDVTEKEITTKGLKSQFVAQIKSHANSMLSSSDWMVIRKVERNVDIPAETAAYRAAVLAECDRICAAIAACADVDALAAVMSSQNWPAA
jgi:hypothetical protein